MILVKFVVKGGSNWEYFMSIDNLKGVCQSKLIINNQGQCLRWCLIQIINNLIKMSVPNTFNPSDYEYLLKSLVEGNMIAKSQSLKRFNTLVNNDKKQFSVYAKRIVLALQDLMFEQKEQVNLLSTMLTLQIINLNPKDIEYYIRTKLLKQVVVNLGDIKPQVRKTSHYCLLAFVKAYKHLDELINFYIENGINSPQPQLRQKSINSFQSIVITQTKYLNWASPQFKKIFELLLQKMKDQSPYVQKASQQCLLTLSRLDQIHTFIKKLNSSYYSLFKLFYEAQKQLGNLSDIKMETTEKMINSHRTLLNSTPSEGHKTSDKGHFSHDKINNQKGGLSRQDSINKQAIIDRIQQIRRNAQNPKVLEIQSSRQLGKKLDSSKDLHFSKQKSILLPSFSPQKQSKKQEESTLQVKQKVQEHPARIIQSLLTIPTPPPKIQKVENVFGKKILEDLKNDKDWKVRLEAIQQLQAKFQIYKQSLQLESLMKMFVPILIKLLADSNFKIAFISLKIIEDILKIPKIKLEVIVPQVMEKLNDSKIALRQNVSKLIRLQYLATKNRLWIDCLIDQIKKNTSSAFREEVLSIFYKLYDENCIQYPFEKIVEEISPLMDDSKTKIKIRTLDLLVLIAMRTQKIDNIKSILMGRLNQVYYEMFLEKVSKETKSIRSTPHSLIETEGQPRLKESKSVAFPSLKKGKTSANNTTSSSLQKYSKTIDAKPLSRASSFTDKQQIQKNKNTQSLLRKNRVESIQLFSTRNLNYEEDNVTLQRGNLTPTESIRKKPLKNYKKKLQRTLDSKLITNYTTDNQNLKPLTDPDKELKNILVNIKSDDWQTSNQALTYLRRIILHHTDILNQPIIKTLSLDIMKHVESLRSSLSKNAVMTINQLASTMKYVLDSELQVVFSKLIKKTLDANSFISQEVKRALISVASNSNENKIVTLLLSMHTSRALPIKQSIILILQNILQLPKIYSKEIERIIAILIDFMGEGALQIRQKTKKLISVIIDKEKPHSKIVKLFPIDILDKIRKRDSTLEKNESFVQAPSKKQVEHQQVVQVQTSSLKKKKITVFPQQFSTVEDQLKRCESGQWKIRLETIVRLVQLAKAYPEEISQHKAGTKMMDILSRQINDPNSKVSANALALFKQLTPKIPRLIEVNISVISNEIFNCFASQKIDIRQASLELFDLISDTVDKAMLAQHLCSGALYGPIRSKASILVKLLKIIPQILGSRKLASARNIYNMVNKVVEEGKSQLLPIMRQIVAACLALGGDDALTTLRQQAKSLAQ